MRLRTRLTWFCLAFLPPALPAAALPSGFNVEVLPLIQTIQESVLSESGEVVFRDHFPFSQAGSIVRWNRTDGLEVVASGPGGAAAGAPGETYTSFGTEDPRDSYGGFGINDAGQVSFQNAIQPQTFEGHNSAVWGPGAGGDLTLLARWGQPLPGDSSGGLPASGPSNPFPGLPYAQFLVGNRIVDDAGRTSFSVVFQIGPGGVTSSNDNVFYRSDGAGSGSVLAREGDPVPGAAPGTTFTGFGAIESRAGTAFAASTTSGPAIFVDNGGSFTRVTPADNAAPGTSGAVFSSYGNARIDVNGGLTVRGTLQTGVGGVTTANDIGWWGADGSGQLALIAREGDHAPGTPAGAVFANLNFPAAGQQRFAGAADLDDAGVAFRGTLVTGAGGVTSANDTGLWRANGSGLNILLAREGDAVSGMPDVTFASFAGNVAMNSWGDVAFVAGFTVGTGGVTTANSRALFYADPSGVLQLVLRGGEVVPGLHPSIGTLNDFEVAGLNDAGELLVKGFTNGGNWLMLISVPEPSTGLLVGLGIAAVAYARRTRVSARKCASSCTGWSTL